MSKSLKPQLSFLQIWNMSFGFMGVQIGYSLQNANTSRILSSIGADPHQLGYFWLAAPLAGLLVQPIVGMSSDKTWTKLGRRIPFILGGAIVSAIAMAFMPNAEFAAFLIPPLIFGAFMLLLMDTSFNVAMQPFRALVSDLVNENQRNIGYSIQSLLINIGAVLGSLLPFLLTYWGVANLPAEGEKVASSVVWSFYLGGAILLITVLVTSFTTKEHPPKEFALYNDLKESEEKKPGFFQLLKSTPSKMLDLAYTQFFSWFALFLMWVYTTQAIAENVWYTTDYNSLEFNEAGNWVGVIFAAYSVFAALFSLVLTPMANKLGRVNTYAFSLALGGLSLVSMYFVHDKYLLLIPMVGVGVAWAAILAMPYAILSSSLPPEQTGVYMGIFNATITLPQIVAGLTGGIILTLIGGNSINMILIAGISMFVAAVLALIIIKKE